MSIAVPIDQLFQELERWGAGYLTTVGDDGRVRFVSIRPVVAERPGGRVLHFENVGRTACANVVDRPNVSIVFPPHPESGGFSLIVDGDASIDEDADGSLNIVPTWAVQHRPAP